MNDFMLKLPGVIYKYSIQKDGNYGFTFISDNCSKILGVDPSAIIHDPRALFNIIIDDDRTGFIQAFNKNNVYGNEWSWEGRINVRGEIRWVETRSSVEDVDNNTFCSGIILDITDRKRREQETELRYESLVEHLHWELVFTLRVSWYLQTDMLIN
jgi:PAS domain S-box-containing protein